MAKDTAQFVPFLIAGDFTELFADLVDELEEAEANWVRTGNDAARQQLIRTSRRIYFKNTARRSVGAAGWDQRQAQGA